LLKIFIFFIYINIKLMGDSDKPFHNTVVINNSQCYAKPATCTKGTPLIDPITNPNLVQEIWNGVGGDSCTRNIFTHNNSNVAATSGIKKDIKKGGFYSIMAPGISEDGERLIQTGGWGCYNDNGDLVDDLYRSNCSSPNIWRPKDGTPVCGSGPYYSKTCEGDTCLCPPLRDGGIWAELDPYNTVLSEQYLETLPSPPQYNENEIDYFNTDTYDTYGEIYKSYNDLTTHNIEPDLVALDKITSINELRKLIYFFYKIMDDENIPSPRIMWSNKRGSVKYNDKFIANYRNTESFWKKLTLPNLTLKCFIQQYLQVISTKSETENIEDYYPSYWLNEDRWINTSGDFSTVVSNLNNSLSGLFRDKDDNGNIIEYSINNLANKYQILNISNWSLQYFNDFSNMYKDCEFTQFSYDSTKDELLGQNNNSSFLDKLFKDGGKSYQLTKYDGLFEGTNINSQSIIYICNLLTKRDDISYKNIFENISVETKKKLSNKCFISPYEIADITNERYSLGSWCTSVNPHRCGKCECEPLSLFNFSPSEDFVDISPLFVAICLFFFVVFLSIAFEGSIAPLHFSFGTFIWIYFAFLFTVFSYNCNYLLEISSEILVKWATVAILAVVVLYVVIFCANRYHKSRPKRQPKSQPKPAPKFSGSE
jgi:hypothetical protein